MTDTQRLDDITARTARRFGIDPDALRTQRDEAQHRHVAIFVARENGIAATAIQDYFDCSDATVYNAVKSVRERMDNHILLRAQVHNLVHGLDASGLPEDDKARAEHAAWAEARQSEHLDELIEMQQDDAQSLAEEPVCVHDWITGRRHDGRGLWRFETECRLCGEEVFGEWQRTTKEEIEKDVAADVIHNAVQEPSPDPDGVKTRLVFNNPTPFATAEPTRPVELPRSNGEAEDNRIPIAEILMSSERRGAFRKRLEELRILKAKRSKGWDEAPVVRVGRGQLTIEVEDVRLVIRGHVALGSLKGVATHRAERILRAITDGRFRIEEES